MKTSKQYQQNTFDKAYRLFAQDSQYYQMASLMLYFKRLHQDKEAFASLYTYLLFSGIGWDKN